MEKVLDASATTDANGDSLSFNWVQTKGTTVNFNADQSMINFMAPEVSSDETLVFDLTVTDDVNSSSATVEVLVKQVNKAPVVSIEPHANVADEGTSISLSSTATDADNDSLTYNWEQISGPAMNLADAQSATVTITLADVSADTTASFKVTVSDGVTSASATTEISIKDKAEQQPNNSEEKPAESGGGGSMGWFMLLGFSTLWRRFKR